MILPSHLLQPQQSMEHQLYKSVMFKTSHSKHRSLNKKHSLRCHSSNGRLHRNSNPHITPKIIIIPVDHFITHNNTLSNNITTLINNSSTLIIITTNITTHNNNLNMQLRRHREHSQPEHCQSQWSQHHLHWYGRFSDVNMTHIIKYIQFKISD